MKKLGIALLALAGIVVFTPATTVLAQVQHEVEVTRADIQADRQAIVAENLPMTEEQAKAFWPLYREYRAELAKTGDRLVALIEDYAKNMDSMTDERAKTMLDELFAIRTEETKIMTSWAKKFHKVLPATKVARFYQIENKLNAIVGLEIAGVVPLVEHTSSAE